MSDAISIFLTVGEGRLSLRSFRMAFAQLQLINNTTGFISMDDIGRSLSSAGDLTFAEMTVHCALIFESAVTSVVFADGVRRMQLVVDSSGNGEVRFVQKVVTILLEKTLGGGGYFPAMNEFIQECEKQHMLPPAASTPPPHHPHPQPQPQHHQQHNFTPQFPQQQQQPPPPPLPYAASPLHQHFSPVQPPNRVTPPSGRTTTSSPHSSVNESVLDGMYVYPSSDRGGSQTGSGSGSGSNSSHASSRASTPGPGPGPGLGLDYGSAPTTPRAGPASHPQPQPQSPPQCVTPVTLTYSPSAEKDGFETSEIGQKFLAEIRRGGMDILFPAKKHDHVLVIIFAVFRLVGSTAHKELIDLVMDMKESGAVSHLDNISKTKVRRPSIAAPSVTSATSTASSFPPRLRGAPRSAGSSRCSSSRRSSRRTAATRRRCP